MKMLSLSRFSNHCEIHSFPTRRSSDLGQGLDHEPVGVLAQLEGAPLAAGADDPARRPGEAGQVVRLAARSEEHTSELQSRLQLGCRLTLDKKILKQNAKREMRLRLGKV